VAAKEIRDHLTVNSEKIRFELTQMCRNPPDVTKMFEKRGFLGSRRHLRAEFGEIAPAGRPAKAAERGQGAVRRISGILNR
jgi:hypothetical protein